MLCRRTRCTPTHPYPARPPARHDTGTWLPVRVVDGTGLRGGSGADVLGRSQIRRTRPPTTQEIAARPVAMTDPHHRGRPRGAVAVGRGVPRPPSGRHAARSRRAPWYLAVWAPRPDCRVRARGGGGGSRGRALARDHRRTTCRCARPLQWLAERRRTAVLVPTGWLASCSSAPRWTPGRDLGPACCVGWPHGAAGDLHRAGRGGRVVPRQWADPALAPGQLIGARPPRGSDRLAPDAGGDDHREPGPHGPAWSPGSPDPYR